MDDRRLVQFYTKGGKVKKVAAEHEMRGHATPAKMKKDGRVKKDVRPAEDMLKKGGRAMAKGGNIMEGRYSTGIVVPKSRRVGVPTVGALGRMK